MTCPPIYLDHAASTAVSEPVRAAMLRTLETEYGNPSSRHPLGTNARALVDTARAQVARSAGAAVDDVHFTSGGTEANNWALLGYGREAAAGQPAGQGEAEVLIGPTEHASVRMSAAALAKTGVRVETMRVDSNGQLDIEDAAQRIGPGTRLVAQMIVNNEYGTRYDMERLARAIAARGSAATHFHIDAVQAAGKLSLDVTGLFETHKISGSLALSAHKIHGPKGIGALVLSRGARRPLPIIFGGGQEHSIRAGTENVPGIVGFGTACAEATRDLPAAFAILEQARRSFESAVATAVPAAKLLVPYSGDGNTSPHVLALLVPGAPAEVWLHHLEELGVYASAGSACQANAGSISPALIALGLNEDNARRMLRFSFSTCTTPAECERAAEALATVASQLAHL